MKKRDFLLLFFFCFTIFSASSLVLADECYCGYKTTWGWIDYDSALGNFCDNIHLPCTSYDPAFKSNQACNWIRGYYSWDGNKALTPIKNNYDIDALYASSATVSGCCGGKIFDWVKQKCYKNIDGSSLICTNPQYGCDYDNDGNYDSCKNIGEQCTLPSPEETCSPGICQICTANTITGYGILGITGFATAGQQKENKKLGDKIDDSLENACVMCDGKGRTTPNLAADGTPCKYLYSSMFSKTWKDGKCANGQCYAPDCYAQGKIEGEKNTILEGPIASPENANKLIALKEALKEELKYNDFKDNKKNVPPEYTCPPKPGLDCQTIIQNDKTIKPLDVYVSIIPIKDEASQKKSTNQCNKAPFTNSIEATSKSILTAVGAASDKNQLESELGSSVIERTLPDLQQAMNTYMDESCPKDSCNSKIDFKIVAPRADIGVITSNAAARIVYTISCVAKENSEKNKVTVHLLAKKYCVPA